MSKTTFRSELLEKLSETFNDEELRDLSWRLGIEYEDLGGRGKKANSRELIAKMERLGLLDKLIAELRQTRPDTEWPDPLADGDNGARERAAEKLSIFNVPHRRNRNFSGREDQLMEIRRQLAGEDTTLAIAGLGGLGKTQLALEYCHREQGTYDLVYWLPANESAALGAALAILAGELGLAGIESGDQELLRRLLFSRLENMDARWLLIYDNADDTEPGELSSYLPDSDEDHHILITTRNPDFSSIAEVLELGIFKPQEALDFLKKRTGRDDSQGAGKLAETLGYLPLALEHAAAYVAQKRVSFARYLRHFETRRSALWAKSKPPDAYHATAATTWELSLEQLADQAAAVQLLELCSFLAPEDIPLGLLQEAAGIDGLAMPGALRAALADDLELDETIAAAQRYSLLERSGDSLAMHRLVQAVMRDRLGEEQAAEWAALAVEILLAAFPEDLEYTWPTWHEGPLLIVHAVAAAGYANRRGVVPDQVATLYNNTGYYLHRFGDYVSAQTYYEISLAIREEKSGSEHPETAETLNNLGWLLQKTGPFDKARDYLERALVIREKKLGPKHLNTADTLSKLGSLLKVMGAYEEARPYLERALEIRKEKLRPEHRDTADSLNRLGMLLVAKEEYQEARPYLEQALNIRAQELGEEDPNTAASLNRMGYLLLNLQEFEEARPFLEKALDIRKEKLGLDHPDTATSLSDMGVLLMNLGEYGGAREYLEQSLAIRKEKLGIDHPDTATSLNDMGVLLMNLGEYGESRPYLEQSLVIREDLLGLEHAYTRTTRENLNSLEELVE